MPLPSSSPRPPAAQDRPRLRTVTTASAFLLVYLALVIPNEFSQLTPAALLRIPVEALAGAVIVLVLPARPRRVVAVLGGVVLGLLTIVRMLDMGFRTVLARPFDPVFDWAQLGSGVTFLEDSIGNAGAIASAAGTVALAVALVVLITLSVLRLTGLVVRYQATTTRAVPALAVVWLTCSVLGAQIVAPVPVAAQGAAALAYRTAVQVPQTLADNRAFAEQAAASDRFDTPDANLLSALHGKDVVLSFVESYGRSAVEDPALAPVVNPVLDAGTRDLAAAGFASRSAFLTSPVAGGGSWMAHATLLSGLWVTSQHSYRNLVGSDRLTLTDAFKRADWRTVGVMPGVTYDWPEKDFYGIDNLYDTHNLGYRAQSFSGFHTPDEYTLSAFQRLEHGKADRQPIMAEVPLVSSHWPWAPIPPHVDWKDIGDGSVYDTVAGQGDPVDVVWDDPARVRAAYAQSVGYSLTSLISWVQTYGDDNLVLVFLGDHQPAPVVTGENAGRDVPITIVARDRAVLDRISGWGWQDGLRPGPQAPVWRMDAFRDRFLTAFGSEPGAPRPPARALH